jgi:hypothetical protein
MMGIKLNAQVMIKNLRNMHEKSLPPTGARRRMESPKSGVSGLPVPVGPPARQGTTHSVQNRRTQTESTSDSESESTFSLLFCVD